MRPLRLLCLLLLLHPPALRGNCIAEGHYALGWTLRPLTGTPFPYTEDITHVPSNAPVGGHLTVSYHSDLRWTRIQSGCAEYGETNINASTAFHLQVRAAPLIAFDPPPTAPRGTRYEVQIRLGLTPDDPNPRIASWEMRRLEGKYPYTERFGGSLQNVPAGNYVQSMWARLLDGPETNAITFDLQWMTGQGVPTIFPAGRRSSDAPDLVGTSWTAVGPELAYDSYRPLDLSLQASFQIAAGMPGALLDFGWSVDGASSGPQYGSLGVPTADMLPAGRVIYDDKVLVPAGHHAVRLYARTSAGETRLEYVTTECFSFPSHWQFPEIRPMQQALGTGRIHVDTQTTGEQPVAISPICGRWTKLLELELPPVSATIGYTWMLNGYVELPGSFDGSSDANVAFETVHLEPSRDDLRHLESTDMGVFDVQLTRVPGGIYMYGDASKWGDWGQGAKVSLWARKLEGCRGATFGGGFDVGKRWLAVKLLPSYGEHL
jgi:hypothetical protein